MFASRTLDDCKQLQVVLPRRIRAGEHLGMELVVVVVIREQAFRRAARSASAVLAPVAIPPRHAVHHGELTHCPKPECASKPCSGCLPTS